MAHFDLSCINVAPKSRENEVVVEFVKNQFAVFQYSETHIPRFVQHHPGFAHKKSRELGLIGFPPFYSWFGGQLSGTGGFGGELHIIVSFLILCRLAKKATKIQSIN